MVGPVLGEFFVQPGMPEKLHSDLAVSQRGLGADFCLEMRCSKVAPATMGLSPALCPKTPQLGHFAAAVLLQGLLC